MSAVGAKTNLAESIRGAVLGFAMWQYLQRPSEAKFFTKKPFQRIRGFRLYKWKNITKYTTTLYSKAKILSMVPGLTESIVLSKYLAVSGVVKIKPQERKPQMP